MLNGEIQPKMMVKVKQSNITIVCLFTLCIIFLLTAAGIIVCWAVFSNGFKNIDNLCDARTHEKKKEETVKVVVGEEKEQSKVEEAVTKIPEICTSRSCVEIASKIIENMDEQVSPCNDFYSFACGRYSESRVVPDDRVKINILKTMGDTLKMRLKFILEQPIASADNKGTKMAKSYFQSCMKVGTIEKLGLKPFIKIVNSLGGWPLLPDTHFGEFSYHWESHAAQVYNTIGCHAIILFGVSVDMKNSKQKLLEFGQLALALRSRKYYLGEGSAEKMKVYKKFVSDVAINFGADPQTVETQASEIVEFEKSLAEISMSDEDQRNVSLSYNPMTFGQLQQKFAGIDWNLYQTTIMGDIKVSDSDNVNVLHVGYFEQLPLVIARTPKRVLANYLVWRMIKGTISYMPTSFRAPELELDKGLSGITSKPPRWKECVTETKTLLGWPLTNTYVERYFNAEAKQETLLVMDYLKRVAGKRLKEMDWMDENSKMMGLKKLEHMKDKIAYPDYLSNETKILEPYGKVDLSRDTYFENTLIVEQNLRNYELSELHRPVDKTIWQSAALQVNAFYNWANNEMVFPVGILQPPMFTVGVPKYVNFASAGFVIGHELTHGYDDQGSRYDHEGNFKPWWEKTTEMSFNKKAQCFIDQYGNITEQITKKKLNGFLTLGENIADNGAVGMAFSAYQLWKESKKPYSEEAKLPGLDNYSNEQLIFLSFANTWCEIVRPSAVEKLIITDAHSMARYRINVPLQNFPTFAKTFGCESGSKMNPTSKCKIW